MGLSVAKLLARKGASVVIVARSVEKLKVALTEISVSLLLQFIGLPIHKHQKLIEKPLATLVLSCQSPNSALPLHQCRPEVPF
jgi:NAD(P)-dependent dehydrogenase (short-subunit alcohol dehydrogenase family)